MKDNHPKVGKFYRQGLIVLAFLTALAWFAAGSLRRDFLLRVAILDIGQGDAILATTSSGSQVLIDGGPAGGGIARRLGERMPFFDRTIELVIATHADADHIGGLIEVLSRYRVKYVLTSGIPSETATFRAFSQELADSGAVIIKPRPGMELWLDDSTVIEVLGPPENFVATDSNGTSIVARLRYGRTAVMLAADAPITEEQAILAANRPVRSDLLKVGHHGSRSSTGDAFLSAVLPLYAAISAGAGNRYGHPTEEVLGRLSEHGIPIGRTDEEGTMEYASDGATLKKM